VQLTGEKVFGVAAIVAGIGLIAAVIAGVEVSSVVLILIPLVIIGWSMYHFVVVRPAPWGVKPPDPSDDHEGVWRGLG
jgi:hypothetical protein